MAKKQAMSAFCPARRGKPLAAPVWGYLRRVGVGEVELSTEFSGVHKRLGEWEVGLS